MRLLRLKDVEIGPRDRVFRHSRVRALIVWLAGFAATAAFLLNRKIHGWANYFCLGPVSPAYRAVEQHTCRRLRQWLCVKHKERAGGNTHFPQQALHQKFGLVRLTARTASFPWAKA